MAWDSGWIMVIVFWLVGTTGYFLVWDRAAQWLLEYALLLAIIAAGLAVAAGTLGTEISSALDEAASCIEAGADALAVINTIMGMAIDTESRTPVIGNVRGGLSGPAIRPIALLKVHQVYEVAGPRNIPIIGNPAVDALVKIGPAAVSALQEAFKKETDLEVKQTIANALLRLSK